MLLLERRPMLPKMASPLTTDPSTTPTIPVQPSLGVMEARARAPPQLVAMLSETTSIHIGTSVARIVWAKVVTTVVTDHSRLEGATETLVPSPPAERTVLDDSGRL